MDEATQRLHFWIKRQGGARLVTEGGPAGEASSPSTAEEEDDQQEQQQQPDVESSTADTDAGPAADDQPEGDEAEDIIGGINLDYLDLRQPRPLSGSTLASSSTLPTAFGNSTLPSKRQSSGKPRDVAALPGDIEVDSAVSESKKQGISNPNRDYSIGTAATTHAGPSNENAPVQQTTARLIEGHTGRINPTSGHSIVPTTQQPSQGSINAPHDTAGLKRTISTLTFDDLTPLTRTAFPPSEATNIPPAYARPRSEVGLPPLLPGEKDDADEEDVEEEETEGAATSWPRGRLRGRPLSSQDYCRRLRMESRESRTSV